MSSRHCLALTTKLASLKPRPKPVPVPRYLLLAGALLLACASVLIGLETYTAITKSLPTKTELWWAQGSAASRDPPWDGHGPWLLLATHNRLLWHCAESGRSHVLHEGQVKFTAAYFHMRMQSSACMLTSCALPAAGCLSWDLPRGDQRSRRQALGGVDPV